MKQKITWNRIAQWLVVLFCALALKQHYSSASANNLRWILAPTTALVELVSGVSFEFESHAGYMSSDRSFLIAPSCAGVNFLITAFLMLSAIRMLRQKAKDNAWGFIPAAAHLRARLPLGRIGASPRRRHTRVLWFSAVAVCGQRKNVFGQNLKPVAALFFSASCILRNDVRNSAGKWRIPPRVRFLGIFTLRLTDSFANDSALRSVSPAVETC